MNIKKLLGKRLQEIRKSRRLTQEQLAELIDIETSSVSNIEVGKYYPTAENLEKILTVLKVRPVDIFSFEHFAPSEELIKEMTDAMKADEKLARLMYKFFISVKF